MTTNPIAGFVGLNENILVTKRKVNGTMGGCSNRQPAKPEFLCHENNNNLYPTEALKASLVASAQGP